MIVQKARDDFSPKMIEALGKRASYICSNPDCRCLTLCPSDKDPEKYIYIGKAAHVTGAAKNGPRYNPSILSEEREAIENGIFLCSNCAEMIDKNKGIDYPVDLLCKWKDEHEKWVKRNLNKSQHSLVTIVEGEFIASGIGEVTGIKITKPAILKPGTKAVAKGEGKITGLSIE